MHNYVLCYCSTVIVHRAWSLIVYAALCILWAVLMHCYKQCGLAGHIVVEIINKLQIFFFTSHPK